MKENPYKGLQIRSDIMEQNNKVLLLSKNLSNRYKTIQKYLSILLYEDSSKLENYLTDDAIKQVEHSIGEIVGVNNRSSFTDVRISFQSGAGDEIYFCVPSDLANYNVDIQINVSDSSILNCIQKIEFNSDNKISSIKTYKLCTKN
jgi:hypothetical protein